MYIEITFTDENKNINDYYPFIEIIDWSMDSEESGVIKGWIDEGDIYLLKSYLDCGLECCAIFDDENESFLFDEDYILKNY